MTKDRLYKWYRVEKWMSTHHLVPIALLMRALIRILFSCDLPYQVEIGVGTTFPHDGLGIVMHHNTKIGRNCKILHGTTFGGRSGLNGAPFICDNVLIGAHAILLGPITVGENAVVGAGSIVLSDVPANAVVVGNPARIVKMIVK